MRKYLVAYGAWLVGVLTMAGIALAWYRHVEGIGLRDLAERVNGPDETPDDGPRP